MNMRINHYYQEVLMRRRYAIISVVAVLIGLVASGCAPIAITPKIRVQNDCFGKQKRFAVVTIASTKKFYGEKGLTQMFKKTDDIPGANTQPIIDKLSPKIIRSLSKSKHFRLVPEKNVLRSKVYKRVEEDKRMQRVLFMSVPMNTAKGYKYITKAEKMAKLANDLKVDGVISVYMNFSIQSIKSKLMVAGLSLGQKQYAATVSITAVAYDRGGKIIWKDSTIKEAEPGDKKAIILIDASDITKTNFKKLHPTAVKIGEKSVGVLLARLDDALEGRSVSRIQKIRDKKLHDKK
jgi:hypothetical protein